MTHPTAFRKLLIANRGEIAMRIIRTARAMGYGTVAVYSDADSGAPHVRAADQAVCIGGAAPAQSYLRVDAIIEAAKNTGADAIHPGYGFLAENAELADACAAAGIVFVGPSAQAIRQMGDKAEAKALMAAAGVPCVPGYQGADQSDASLLDQARRIGFPVMIKATAGGGGRGMRPVRDESGFAEALRTARSEAASAFGNNTVLLEKAIIAPRHIEIQIMADSHGTVIYLGERDCSVQRRHQKLIEESPSPAVSPALRAAMGAASIKAAHSIGYVGAGTFEYLLDNSGAFYFMEMNTRLQVEHPVTEMITGLDLVALQLRVAAGEPLGIAQEDVTFQGHAIEVRLCAEDANAGFVPQSGTLNLWEPAAGIRVDHALRCGSVVPPQYDSMIAKLIAHGHTREDAQRKLLAGLEQTIAIGVTTNRDFLSDCLRHPVFTDGAATTGFIADHADTLLHTDAAIQARAAMVAAAILRAAPGVRLMHGFSTPLRLLCGEVAYQPVVQALPDGLCRVDMAGHEPLDLRVLAVDGPRVTLDMGGVSHQAAFLHDANGVWVQFDRRGHRFADLTFAPAVTAATPGSDGMVRATMTGTVLRVDVALGDTVSAGQRVAVVEAMKMEHAHVSPLPGVVTAVHVQPGAQVAAHALLVEIKLESGSCA